MTGFGSAATAGPVRAWSAHRRSISTAAAAKHTSAAGPTGGGWMAKRAVRPTSKVSGQPAPTAGRPPRPQSSRPSSPGDRGRARPRSGRRGCCLRCSAGWRRRRRPARSAAGRSRTRRGCPSQADRDLVRGVEDEEEDESDAAHGGRVALKAAQQEEDRKRHQRDEQQEGGVHGHPGAGVVAYALVDAIRAAGWVEPQHGRESQRSRNQKDAGEGDGHGFRHSHAQPARGRRGTGRFGGRFSGVRGPPRSGGRAGSTRRESVAPDGRPSLPKMLDTYFSTARREITSLSAMPWFERPSAISSSTSLTRRELGERVVSAMPGQQCRDDDRIDRRPALRHALHCVDELRDVADPVLEQIAGAVGRVGEQLHCQAHLDVLGEHEHAHRRMAGADLQGGLHPLIVVRREA